MAGVKLAPQKRTRSGSKGKCARCGKRAKGLCVSCRRIGYGIGVWNVATPGERLWLKSIAKRIVSHRTPRLDWERCLGHAAILRKVSRGRCRYCNDPLSLDDYHLDHILPQRDGGRTEYGNLQVICSRCNLSKGARSEPVWTRNWDSESPPTSTRLDGSSMT